MHAFIHKSSRVLEGISLASLAILLASVLIQIIMRNIFNSGSVVIEELARFSLVALVFLMTPVLVITRGHIIVDLVISRLTPSGTRIFEIITQGLTLSFSVFLLFSINHVMQRNWDVRTPALRMPNFIMYIPIILGLVYMGLGSLLYLIHAIQGKETDQ